MLCDCPDWPSELGETRIAVKFRLAVDNKPAIEAVRHQTSALDVRRP
jgi:hypothetical protein